MPVNCEIKSVNSCSVPICVTQTLIAIKYNVHVHCTLYIIRINTLA